jgi:hypothetical protein
VTISPGAEFVKSQRATEDGIDASLHLSERTKPLEWDVFLRENSG